MMSPQRLIERIRNVPGLGRDVIFVVLLIVTGIVCSVYIFSNYGYIAPWSDRVVVAAEFEKAPALRPQSRQEVRIAGVTVGKITSAEPLPNGNARVVMSIEPGHRVYSNAKAVLRSKSPLNLMYIALDPGGPPGKPLPDDGTIPVSQTHELVQPWELLHKFDGRTRAAVTSLVNQADAALATAPRHLPGGLRATDTTMTSFRPVVEQLQSRREAISQLVTSMAKISAAVGKDDERLARLTASLQRSLSVVAGRDKELSQTLAQVPGFSKELRHAMTSSGSLTKQLNPTLDAVHAASEKLPPALSRLTQTVDEAGRLVDAAKPVVGNAKPVVADLRPLAGHVNKSLNDLAPVTGHLPSATRRIVPWMDDLAAFVYQTSSSFSLSDVNGGLGRANLTVDVTNPLGGYKPQPGTGSKAGN